jgi:ketosteroid isomerase-like protein
MSNSKSPHEEDDKAHVLRLDEAWNEAYRRHDRSQLAPILADDFIALTASNEPITKATLMIDPPGRANSVTFSDQEVFVFGDAAVSRGRLRLEIQDRTVDQRFLRVFAKRDGLWRAVSVAVTPVVV